MEHSTEVLYNRTMVYCTPAHRFGSDALLLARFCAPKRAQKAADLCSGCGIVALEWHDRGHRGPCTALELQPEGSALLAEAVAQQGLDHITPVCADLRSWREGEGSFDLPVEPEQPKALDRMALRQLVSRLEPLDRRLIILRYSEECTQSRTAEILGMTQVQVSRREKKILEGLRKQLLC